MLQKKTTLLSLITIVFLTIHPLSGAKLTAEFDASQEIEELKKIAIVIQTTASDGKETLENVTKELNENIKSTGNTIINEIKNGTDKISAQAEQFNTFMNAWSTHLRTKLPIQIASTVAIVFGIWMIKNGLESNKKDDRYISPEWSIGTGITLTAAGSIALVWTCYEG